MAAFEHCGRRWRLETILGSYSQCGAAFLPSASRIAAAYPAQTIVKFADDGGFDLIIVGYSDHSELWAGCWANSLSSSSSSRACTHDGWLVELAMLSRAAASMRPPPQRAVQRAAHIP